MKTIEKEIYRLCDTIDCLREEVEFWKEKYERVVKEQAEDSQRQLESAQQGVANALMFALSVHDDENGNLVIPAKERKELAKNWK